MSKGTLCKADCQTAGKKSNHKKRLQVNAFWFDSTRHQGNSKCLISFYFKQLRARARARVCVCVCVFHVFIVFVSTTLGCIVKRHSSCNFSHYLVMFHLKMYSLKLVCMHSSSQPCDPHISFHTFAHTYYQFACMKDKLNDMHISV